MLDQEERAMQAFIKNHGQPIGVVVERIDGLFPAVTPDGFSCQTFKKLPAGTRIRLWKGGEKTI